MSLLKNFVRLKFAMTSRESANRMIRSERDRTLAVCEKLGDAGCARSVQVPKMLGVDEDMRSWSVFQILEHNNIVNRRITAQILFATGDGPEPDPDFDAKCDVMPSDDAGPGQIPEFENSIADHLRLVSELPKLRDTTEATHPLFGPFDAHKWNCMLGFHLQVHRKQAEALAKIVKAEVNRDL